MLPTVLTTQSDMIKELFDKMSHKIDRIEFSQIVQNKANSYEVSRLVNELIKARSFEQFQKNEKVHNLMSDSISQANDDTFTERTGRHSGLSQTPECKRSNLDDVNFDQIHLLNHGQHFGGINETDGTATERAISINNQQMSEMNFQDQ